MTNDAFKFQLFQLMRFSVSRDNIIFTAHSHSTVKIARKKTVKVGWKIRLKVQFKFWSYKAARCLFLTLSCSDVARIFSKGTPLSKLRQNFQVTLKFEGGTLLSLGPGFSGIKKSIVTRPFWVRPSSYPLIFEERSRINYLLWIIESQNIEHEHV